MKHMLPNVLAFVDTETTGFSASRNRIIEIGIIRVEDGKIVKKYQTLLNPECFLPDEIEFLTGITKKDLESAPTFYQVKDEIKDLLQDAVLVAHNVRFDYSFLKNEFKRVEMKFAPKQLCTVKLYKKLFPKTRHHNLDALISQFNITCKKRHRAFDDAWVLYKFYEHIQKLFSQELLESTFSSISKKPSIPLGLSHEDIDKLPEAPGVYIFYGTENIPLYIGKSVNIRDRVLSHFSSDHSSSLEMKVTSQVVRIETIKTSGELGALLKEAALIKSMCPLYNRKLRYARKVICLLKKETPQGYFGAELTTVDEFTNDTAKNLLGVFKSQKQAKEFINNLSREHVLCNKLLGIEKTLSECFAYRLDRCKGACKGLENPVIYNFRFTNAFIKTKIKPWPFSGPIMIVEKNEDQGLADAFFLYDWCFLQHVEFEQHANLRSLKEFVQQHLFHQTFSRDIPFDMDTYRILSSFIAKPTNHKYITVLGEQMFSQLPLALV